MSILFSYSKLQDLVGSNAERMAFIDFKLQFTGIINRSDLYNEFGIAEAAASRMFTQYSKLRPTNMIYDRALKANAIQVQSFNPLLLIEAETALGMLANGFNKNKFTNKPILPYARIGKIPNPLDSTAIAKITRAIFGGYSINCCYISANSENHDIRTLVPLAVLFDGRSWIFRAYDRNESGEVKFKNYNFSRSTNIEESFESKKLNYEELSEDNMWNQTLPLVLELHPSLGDSDKASVRKDFGMVKEQNDLILTERAALLWLLTKQWHIDSSEVPSKSKYYKFIFKNRDMLKAYLKN
tara:strand:- start:4029 stop:4922 length:894 start_codon:yes stop_codon:yes gene_type:complete